MADVFISHHSNSAGKIARQIADELVKHGISCWYAERNVYADDYVGMITRAIRECKIFLLILNQGALKSQYVENEVALAFRRMNNYEKLTVVPFRVDDCDLRESPAFDYYLVHIQIINGNPPDKAHIERLVQRIGRLTGNQRTPPPPPSKPKKSFLWWRR